MATVPPYHRTEVACFASAQIGYVFKPSTEELAAGMLCFCYCPVRDGYYRSMACDVQAGSVPALKRWDSGMFTFTHVFRKDEQDWSMVS